jgi:hypothetical protein
MILGIRVEKLRKNTELKNSVVVLGPSQFAACLMSGVTDKFGVALL